MTNNLTQAIEEVKRAAERGWYWPGAAMSKDTVTNTIINAVATGDLTPKADHEAVLAWPDGGAVDARLLAALRSGEQADADGCRVIVSREACENAADIIEALAPALEAAEAELQALRDERDRLDAATNTLSEMWEGEQTARHSAEAANATLRAQVAKLEVALLWCSGSDDFHEGGKARKGWLKLCAPLLKTALTEGAAP